MNDWPDVPTPPAQPTTPPAAQTIDPDRARTLWKLDRQRNRRRVSQALDDLCVKMYGPEEAARYGIRTRRGRE